MRNPGAGAERAQMKQEPREIEPKPLGVVNRGLSTRKALWGSAPKGQRREAESRGQRRELGKWLPNLDSNQEPSD